MYHLTFFVVGDGIFVKLVYGYWCKFIKIIQIHSKWRLTYVLSSRSVKNKWADISFLYFSITSLAWITLSIIQCWLFCNILCCFHLLLLHIKNRRTLVFSLTFVPITWHGDLVCRLQWFFSLPELMLFFSTLPYWDSVGSMWWKILHFKLSNLFFYVSVSLA